MHKIVLILLIVVSLMLASCQKEYVCVCTDSRTGEKNYGDKVSKDYLEVYYKDQLIISNSVLKSDAKINKGDVLEFVVSDKGGGEIIIPKLVCLTLEEAEFLLSSQNLSIGEITEKGAITDKNAAYILVQEPAFDDVSKISMGSSITVTIAQSKPGSCR